MEIMLLEETKSSFKLWSFELQLFLFIKKERNQYILIIIT